MRVLIWLAQAVDATMNRTRQTAEQITTPEGWCAKGTVRPAMSLRHAARGFELLGRRFETCRPDWVARDHD